MSFAAARLSEIPLRQYSLSLASHSLFSSSSTTTTPKPSFNYFLQKHTFICTCSITTNKNHDHKSRSPSAPWPSKRSRSESDGHDPKPSPSAATAEKNRKGQNAIDRIVFRLRNLGLGSDDEAGDDGEGGLEGPVEIDGGSFTGEERLGDLLQREWVRPDFVLEEEKRDEEFGLLPWEKGESERETGREEEGGRGVRRRTVKAPTLAELTLEDEVLRRLRRVGMFIKERINIPKAGLTQAVLQKMHDKWRKEEVVRLKFHEVLAHNMKLAHELVEVG